VTRSKKGILLSQRKYKFDLLLKVEMLRCGSIDTPMDENTRLLSDHGQLFEDIGRYMRMVKKLNYLTVTKPNITFAISVVSHFLSASRTTHLEVVIRILRYLKKDLRIGLFYSDHGHTRVAGFSDTDWAGCLFDRRLTTEYCVFLGENLVS